MALQYQRNSRLLIWKAGVTIKRGEIYMAGLDSLVGHEISKTRPVVVVSNDVGNKYSGTITVVPLTSQNLSKIYPFEILVPKSGASLPKASKAKADQIRTLDKKRLKKKVGLLSKDLMSALDFSIKIHLNLT